MAVFSEPVRAGSLRRRCLSPGKRRPTGGGSSQGEGLGAGACWKKRRKPGWHLEGTWSLGRVWLFVFLGFF